VNSRDIEVFLDLISTKVPKDSPGHSIQAIHICSE
jgi:hypothetical protein